MTCNVICEQCIDCAGNPAASGPPFTAYNQIAADTFGVVYRAFGPIFNGGIGVVDPWTKQMLKDCEQYQLQKAGVALADAKAQAEADVEKTIATAPSLKKCCCKTPNILMWVAIIVGAAILLMIFGN